MPLASAHVKTFAITSLPCVHCRQKEGFSLFIKRDMFKFFFVVSPHTSDLSTFCAHRDFIFPSFLSWLRFWRCQCLHILFKCRQSFLSKIFRQLWVLNRLAARNRSLCSTLDSGHANFNLSQQ